MKGIFHFISGVAAAACFPRTVPGAAVEKNPVCLIPGAAFGILPDSIEETYGAVATVDMFDGPAFGFESREDGREVAFS